MLNTLIIIAVLIILLVSIRAIRNKGVSSIAINDAFELADNVHALILDVRTKEEFDSGHLSNATHIPLNELQGRLSELVSYKEKPLLVYCHSGGRSAAACQILKQAGFADVNNMQGGISAWINAGKKVVK